MLVLIFFLVFTTAGMCAYMIIPAVTNQVLVVNEKRQQRLSNRMEQVITRQEAKKISRFLIFAPFGFGALFATFFDPQFRLAGFFMGLVAGYVFPSIYIKLLTGQTQRKFHDQLVDSLMIMSSSFRGGLSLVQAMEAVTDEMPDPIRREFEVVLGENKMGVSLEEALYHLYNRMPSAAMQQMITAILLARETGGNLPAIFTRIVGNIRETKKIQQNLATLTIQGKIQGFIMALLPVAFAMIVYSSNRRLFDNMLASDFGRGLLIFCVIWEIIGAFLIIKISTFKDF